MEFFKSEIIQEEMRIISDIQEKLYSKIFSLSSMSKEDKLYHIDLLGQLLEKQRILYTRISLSDDPEAVKMKDSIMDSARQLGFPKDTDIANVFGNMHKIIENMKKSIDV